MKSNVPLNWHGTLNTNKHIVLCIAKAERIFAKYSLASTVVPYFLTHCYADSAVFK